MSSRSLTPRSSGAKSLRQLPEIQLDPVESARLAGLRYVSDDDSGIGRKKSGKGFSYIGLGGKTIKDRKVIERINALAIPPAYKNVWICALENGHIQATGFDERNRKQYRYHPKWREVRDETKFARTIAFAHALPKIRARTEPDLAKKGAPREKVLAAVVQLLEKTAIRVGNEEYARQNGSYGLTTMRNQHAQIKGGKVHFHFKGKSGKWHDIDLKDRKLASVIKKLGDLPGQSLFQYLDEEGQTHHIESSDVNAYLQEIAGEEFTAKDFRTWAGTVSASLALAEFEKFETTEAAQANIVAAVKSVSQHLGNTPAVCRKSYIHPAVLEAYLDGSMLESLKQKAEETLEQEMSSLKPEEAAVLGLLQQKLAQKTAEISVKEK
ncbi:DNA topoisomerase-1 [Abditibacterium utsteinense]|uniref:DNA topoisomerase n=1 Tax=Abditibacterium utsteinense TaxID=1960156 RepID=A0A2S8SQH6_9BACT|nr:DNA topoisomerase IB [Abditibacterium utsteinense]PQV63038.1 DNA topoisomerase-1 [Abditibacterium utsteinense]